METRKYLFLLIFICFVAGCVTQPDVAGKSADIGNTYVGESEKPQYWWYARFRMGWPPDTDPDFSIDLVLADAVIKPLLHAYRKNIKYWRFHRRAVRDNAGHQFSFIFYTDRDTARNIYDSLIKDEFAIRLRQEKIIDEIIPDNIDNNLRTDIGDTSDKNWAPEIQSAWPVYIMGVSNMWLQLIEQETGDLNRSAATNAILEKYRTANRKITALWQSEAQHALLHHLNAIFGYEPLMIKKGIQF